MKFEINHNFSAVKVGEIICYHIGNLGEAKAEKKEGEFTDEARILQTIASSIFHRSCALNCTGEFELKQQRLGWNNYAYLAKRIKEF